MTRIESRILFVSSAVNYSLGRERQRTDSNICQIEYRITNRGGEADDRRFTGAR